MKARDRYLKDINSEAAWKYVKKECRLTDEEVWMARRMKRTPLNVLRMQPNENEGWKDPVALRIRRLYDKYGTSPSKADEMIRKCQSILDKMKNAGETRETDTELS